MIPGTRLSRPKYCIAMCIASLCLQIFVSSRAVDAAKSQKPLQGTVEKLEGNKRLLRPRIERKEANLKSGAGIFDQANFDLSASKKKLDQKAATGIFAPSVSDLLKTKESIFSTTGKNEHLFSEWNILKDYDVYFVVDASGSMNIADCPATGSADAFKITRWEWADRELRNFADKTQTVLQQGVTVIAFNNYFRRIDHCHESDLKNIFAINPPVGGTLLGPVLRNVFESSRASSKRILLVLIGDGTVNDPADMESELSRATDEADLGRRLRVLMLQVGETDQNSNAYDVAAWGLVKFGVKDSVVKAISFRELCKTGLMPAIQNMFSAKEKP